MGKGGVVGRVLQGWGILFIIFGAIDWLIELGLEHGMAWYGEYVDITIYARVHVDACYSNCLVYDYSFGYGYMGLYIHNKCITYVHL